jgi:hypothetical protein
MVKEEPKKKEHYFIVLEGMVPVTLQLETWAEDEEEALKNLDILALVKIREPPKIDLPRLQRKKVTIKEAFTSLIKIVKSF